MKESLQQLGPPLMDDSRGQVTRPKFRLSHFLFVIFIPLTLSAQRKYWPTPLDTLAACHIKHTHVAVRAIIDSGYPRTEPDGDTHVRLVWRHNGPFIIAECIPLAPCTPLRTKHAGDTVTVYGISRRDPEHGWCEVHPVEKVN